MDECQYCMRKNTRANHTADRFAASVAEKTRSPAAAEFRSDADGSYRMPQSSPTPLRHKDQASDPPAPSVVRSARPPQSAQTAGRSSSATAAMAHPEASTDGARPSTAGF